jgi:hypothetical protein
MALRDRSVQRLSEGRSKAIDAEMLRVRLEHDEAASIQDMRRRRSESRDAKSVPSVEGAVQDPSRLLTQRKRVLHRPQLARTLLKRSAGLPGQRRNWQTQVLRRRPDVHHGQRRRQKRTVQPCESSDKVPVNGDFDKMCDRKVLRFRNLQERAGCHLAV